MTGDSIRIGSDGRLSPDKPASLPEVLDILIAGAGPAGTAVAFRARELSLSALALDADDILKRIRDYAKEKPILPDYGPGDKMRFPRAGELINLLHFDAVDKDEMHAAWKRYYVRHNIPVQVGTELTGLERQDGLWAAKVWNHNLKSAQTFRARHIVLALGRGVPRRFDIPGDTDGIAFRLNDPATYVGIGPVCIVGGGTSAAEAVIAISNAKIKAGDECEVYWSYRGTKLPRVSRALAEPFFEAYVVNGNVRYLPLSDPAAVVIGTDKKGYLSVRTDRRAQENRPGETVHLEFLKENCIACIGEDIPEDFLSGMGIRMRSQEPGGKKRLVVSPLLESEQPNVYVIGDTLSDFYLQTTDFEGDPGAFERIRRPGNVKAALRDGVFVTEVIKQRLEGRATIEVQVEFDEPLLEKKDKTVTTILRGPDPEGPPPESKKEAAPLEEVAGYVIRLLPSGTEEQRTPLKQGHVVTVGRKDATITVDTDTLLSDAHASIAHGPEGFLLRDDGSETGVFLRLRPAEAMDIPSGGLLRAGRQFLVLGIENGAAFADHYDEKGTSAGRYPLGPKEAIWGRNAPDRILEAKDNSLSKRHLSIVYRDGKIFVTDLKSTNGVFWKVETATKIVDGDEFRAGRQRFILRAQAEVERSVLALESLVVVSQVKQAPSPEAPPKSVVKAPAGKVTVTFTPAGKTVNSPPDMTILEIAEENGVAIEAECRGGACGVDPVRVTSGAENLGELGKLEKKTLVERCNLKDPDCRLACMAIVNGPVTVEVLPPKA